MRYGNTACAMMALAGLVSAADAGTTITVRNSSDAWVTLADLIVYDWSGNAHEILRANDPSDDVIFPPDSEDRFETDLDPADIASIAVSYPDLIGGEQQDIEWIVDNTYGPEVLNPTFFKQDQDPDNDFPLHAYAGDDEGAMLDLPVGTRLYFRNGTSSNAPGLELGTQFDYEEGYIWSYFTGWAVVVANNLTVQLEESVDCPADLDGDGDTDAENFFLYLDYFAEGYIDGCDVDEDGDCDAEDFFGFLDRFAMGC